MDLHLLYQLRFIPVIVLLGVAAALLRHPDDPPLALRGLRRVLGGTRDSRQPVARGRRWLAFVCVLAALTLALL